MKGDDFLYCLDAEGTTFKFLSQALLKELNAETIEQLAGQEWPSDTGNAHLDLGYRYLRRYFHFSGTDRRTQLAVEYARVFLAAGVHSKDHGAAVPYESVFTSEDHEMMGPARDDVKRRYAADGFAVDPILHEPEDHLSFELEYLAAMIGRTLEQLDGEDEKTFHELVRRQLEFLDAHLLNWTPALLQAVENYAKNAFYLGLMHLVIGSCEQYRAVLSEVRANGLETDVSKEALDEVLGSWHAEQETIAQAEEAARTAEQQAAAQGFSVSAKDAYLPVDEAGAVRPFDAEELAVASGAEEGARAADAADASDAHADGAGSADADFTGVEPEPDEGPDEEPDSDEDPDPDPTHKDRIDESEHPVARPPHKKPETW